MLYDTPAKQDASVFVRPRNDFDGALPSGAATATLVLLKMAVLTGNREYGEIAQNTLNSVSNNIGNTPMGYSQWLCALDYYLSSPHEIALIGDKNDSQTQALAKIVSARWLPNKIFAALDPTRTDSLKDLPLFKGRSMVNSRPTAYVCVNNTCKAPITDAEKLGGELSSI
jgi:uncharacterized protein YyaL (SSP411 family)